MGFWYIKHISIFFQIFSDKHRMSFLGYSVFKVNKIIIGKSIKLDQKFENNTLDQFICHKLLS